MDSFGDHLQGWLDQRGWTRYRLAAEADLSESLVSKWLHPDRRRRVVPGPASCRKVAHALGLNADDVLALAGHRDAVPEPINPEPDPSRYLDLFSLPAWKRQAVEAIWRHGEPAHRRSFVRTNVQWGGDLSAKAITARRPTLRRGRLGPVAA